MGFQPYRFTLRSLPPETYAQLKALCGVLNVEQWGVVCAAIQVATDLMHQGQLPILQTRVPSDARAATPPESPIPLAGSGAGGSPGSTVRRASSRSSRVTLG